MLFGLLLHYFFDKQQNIITIFPISIRSKSNQKLAICKVQYLSQMKDERLRWLTRVTSTGVCVFNVYWTEICDGAIKTISTLTLSVTKGKGNENNDWGRIRDALIFFKTFQIWTEVPCKSWKKMCLDLKYVNK